MRLRPAALAAALLPALAGPAAAQSDDQLVASAMSAGPDGVARHATIAAIDGQGGMRTLRQGANAFTCVADGPSPGDNPMCLDANGLAWLTAYLGHAEPPAGAVGFGYMLAGGAMPSNVDPYAAEPPAGGAPIRLPPHVMIVNMGGAAEGHARPGETPDPAQPWVMWAGTPYEHLVVPVDFAPAGGGSAAAGSQAGGAPATVASSGAGTTAASGALSTDGEGPAFDGDAPDDLAVDGDAPDDGPAFDGDAPDGPAVDGDAPDDPGVDGDAPDEGPLACSGFAGRWETSYGPLQMDSEGGAGMGTYMDGTASLEGSIAGDVMTGRWTEPDRDGTFTFTLSPDGRHFTGSWADAGGGGDAWNGDCVPPVAG